MDPIPLSICIATYNRAAFIGETLESIISQATDEVEIVIVDGGSSDNTGEVVTRYQERFPNLRYVRQETNLGVDRDFNRSVEIARGNYCWLMSDDDLLKPGAIQAVLAASRRGYGLIVVNADVCSVDFSHVLVDRRLPIFENRVYSSAESTQLFRDVADYLSFIGGVVIRRDIWIARKREPYFGTVFIHIGVIFQAPLPAESLVISEPLISIRYGNAMWTSRSFEIWMIKWPGLLWSFSHIPEETLTKVCPRDPWRRYTVLLLYRAKGAYTSEEYREWIAPRLASWREKLPAWAIAHSPEILVNLLGDVCFSTWHRRYRLHLEDIRTTRSRYRIRLKELFRTERSPD